MDIAAHTLGCKLNFAETSDIIRKLSEHGHRIVDFSQPADFYIINTCTVTSIAEKKCRTAIRQAHRTNPLAQIAVIGCFAQVAATDIEKIEGVTMVLGNDRKHLLPEIVDGTRNQALPDDSSFTLQYSSVGRTRTFFKIQDGCDYFCSYCAIPYARGRSQSASIEETVCMARHIAQTGTKEVILTGVNTGTFGFHHNQTLIGLLRELDAIEGISRYRISSIEPNLLTDEIIEFIASSRAFLPHFHIPLQAGSDHVLTLMRRRYDTTLFRDKVERIKSLMPDACIATDVMAGFNGETEDEFAKAVAFIDSLPISYLHVFTYSDRPGTAAMKLGKKIPVNIRRSHTAVLLALSQRKHHTFIESQLGRRRPVLWESTNHGGHMEGWTDNYIRVATPFNPAMENTIQPVLLTTDNILRDSQY